jgi:tetratricopeptide (TPR) repeat protein
VGGAWLLTSQVCSWLAARDVTAALDALPRERVALLERAVRIDPRSGRALFDLGIARFEAGDREGALEELMRASHLAPGPTTAVALATAHVAREDPEGAIGPLRQATRWHPASFRANANLASVLTTVGDFSNAEKYLARARAVYPGHPRLAEISERLRREQSEVGSQLR